MTLDPGGVRVVGKIEMAHIVGGEREDELALPGRNTGISIWSGFEEGVGVRELGKHPEQDNAGNWRIANTSRLDPSLPSSAFNLTGKVVHGGR